jgi:hypothetical protein
MSAFENLPTGKPHVSFSELKEWQDCSYRHKLRHIDKIDLFVPSPILDFGTAVHASCEDFLKTRVMNTDVAVNLLIESFEKNKEIAEYKTELLDSFKREAIDILADIPQFLEDNFPSWETVDAEHALYEAIEKHPNHAFKGFIDGIIKTKGKRGEDQYWLLDWKTTAWGWTADKKSDHKIQQQLIFYKNFWSGKTNIDPRHVRCGFVLLKRSAKRGSHCELVKVSVGDVTSGRALKALNSMISSVRKGIALKNRDSCTYCQYKNTQHCV